MPNSNSAPTTPLTASTVPRDLLARNSQVAANSGANDEVSSVAAGSLTITAGKLKDLEKEIEADVVELGFLKDSIKRSEQLTTRMTRILNAFESRMGDLERIVMPVYRNILTMSQVNDRIEGTIGLVEQLVQANDQVRKEVVILLPGPTKESLLAYLDCIVRLEAICRDLRQSELSFCKISQERACSALDDARGKVLKAFTDWLQEEQGSRFAAETTAALQAISSFLLGDSGQFAKLVAIWIDVRSNYLASNCERAFLSAQNFEKKGGANFVLGSHPLPVAFQLAFKLLEAERSLLAQVFPLTAVGPTFLRTAQIVRDLAVSTVENIVAKMKKAFNRREYADQVYLLDVVGGSYYAIFSNHQNNSENFAVQVLQPAVKYFVTSVAGLINDLFGEIRGTIPRALERPFTVPETATVYELTSITLNVLKRLPEHRLVLEAILSQLAADNWDGSLVLSSAYHYRPIEGSDNVNQDDTSHEHVDDNTSTEAFPATQRFFSDILSALETCLDAKSKSLRKPVQILLFQLNNYQYILKQIRVAVPSLIGPLLSDSAVRRFEQIIEALQRSFLNSWSAIAALISENAHVVSSANIPSSSHVSPKERLKAFTLEFDEAARIQSTCSIADSEVREILRKQIHDTVLSPYIYFYNQNQNIFTATGTTLMGTKTPSKYHDPDYVEGAISHLFEG